MAGEFISFLRLFRLKDALQATTRDKVFVDYKKFQFLAVILNNQLYWDCLFAMIQAIYPFYRMLRLCDMKLGGMPYLKYYAVQADRLLGDGMTNLMEKWNDPRMPSLEIKAAKLTAPDRAFLLGNKFFKDLFKKIISYHSHVCVVKRIQ